eukprot:UN23740
MSKFYRGVYYCPETDLYKAQISSNGNTMLIGSFETDLLAARAVNVRSKELELEEMNPDIKTLFYDIPSNLYNKHTPGDNNHTIIPFQSVAHNAYVPQTTINNLKRPQLPPMHASVTVLPSTTNTTTSPYPTPVSISTPPRPNG